MEPDPPGVGVCFSAGHMRPQSSGEFVAVRVTSAAERFRAPSVLYLNFGLGISSAEHSPEAGLEEAVPVLLAFTGASDKEEYCTFFA